MAVCMRMTHEHAKTADDQPGKKVATAGGSTPAAVSAGSHSFSDTAAPAENGIKKEFQQKEQADAHQQIPAANLLAVF